MKGKCKENIFCQYMLNLNMDSTNNLIHFLPYSFGYKVIRNVGDDFTSVTDRLVWGAVGTLMRLEIKDSYLIGSKEIREFLSNVENISETN